MTTTEFTAADFRDELQKIMPGYEWTVHRANKDAVRLEATGKQSSGFNRLSTLNVIRWAREGQPVTYEVRSAPYGAKSPWAHTVKEGTLARALRRLQKHYEAQRNHFASLAGALEEGRKAAEQPAEPVVPTPA